MDRRLLFPVVAATAWAQASPDAIKAEKALRDRVQQFFQLQVDKKYRQAEALVAEDTKDLYFSSSKPDLQGFSISKVELLDNNTKAKVTVKTKSTMMMMGVGRLPLEVPAVILWKIENGQWVWYVDAQAAVETPFGPIKAPTGGTPAAGTGGAMPAMPDVKDFNLESFMKQVTIDRTNVTLSGDRRVDSVVISNAMPGFVDVTVENKIPGLKVDIDNSHVPAAGNATLKFTKAGEGKVNGVVQVTVAPLNTVFAVRVQID